MIETINDITLPNLIQLYGEEGRNKLYYKSPQILNKFHSTSYDSVKTFTEKQNYRISTPSQVDTDTRISQGNRYSEERKDSTSPIQIRAAEWTIRPEFPSKKSSPLTLESRVGAPSFNSSSILSYTDSHAHDHTWESRTRQMRRAHAVKVAVIDSVLLRHLLEEIPRRD